MSKADRLHPTYCRAPKAHQWTKGPLSILDLELSKIAKKLHREDAGEEKWAWFVLPRGALVAKRILGRRNGRFELRIAREKAPAEEDLPAWENEVAVFLRNLGFQELDGTEPCRHPGRHLYRHHEEIEEKAEALFIELRLGEIRPEVSRCHDCYARDGEIKEIPWFVGGSVEGQRCNEHALEAGRRAHARKQEQSSLELGGKA